MRRNIVMHKYTLDFETARLGLVSCKENLIHKITIVSTIQFNFFIDFEWSSWWFQPISSHYCLLVALGTFELDEIYFLVHLMSYIKITFMYLLAQFWCSKIFILVIRGFLGDFLCIFIHKLFYSFWPSWLPHFQPFQIFEHWSKLIVLL